MKVELLEDIIDEYYNVHLKKGIIISPILNHPAAPTNWGSDTLLLRVHGHGCYTYATKDQYIKM